MCSGDCKQTITTTKKYQSFDNHRDGLDNTIKLLKTDLNEIICLLEID